MAVAPINQMQVMVTRPIEEGDEQRAALEQVRSTTSRGRGGESILQLERGYVSDAAECEMRRWHGRRDIASHRKTYGDRLTFCGLPYFGLQFDVRGP